MNRLVAHNNELLAARGEQPSETNASAVDVQIYMEKVRSVLDNIDVEDATAQGEDEEMEETY